MTAVRGLQPSVVADLRDLGYTVDTYEAAIDAARAAYGLGPLAASVLLTGRSDLVGPVRLTPTPSGWPKTLNP